MEQGKKGKVKKALSICVNVLMYVFLVLCIFLLVVSVTSKKDSDGAVNIFGRQMRLVISNSMEKCDETYDSIKGYKIKDIPVRSMVFIELVPENQTKADAWYGKLKVGDVLTFKYTYSTQETITHRIVSIERNEDSAGNPTKGYTIILQGDNKASGTAVGQQTIDTSAAESFNYVIGKVTGQSKVLGNLVYAVKQPIGIALIVIVPCAIIMIMEIIRIVSVLGEEKRRKAAEIQQQQSNEIEELRRQLASLQAGISGGAPPVQSQTAVNTEQATEAKPVEQTAAQVPVQPTEEQPTQAPAEEQATAESAETATPQESSAPQTSEGKPE